MRSCEHCGFMSNNRCFVMRIYIKPEENKFYSGCTYFMEPVFEDGEALEPAELLLLAENEIRRHK